MSEVAQIIMQRRLSDDIRPREKTINGYELADPLTTTRYDFVSGITRRVPRLEEATHGT
ncbi:MAG: hypothetical protein WBO58_12720 [Gammaproteobacteria bacterium]